MASGVVQSASSTSLRSNQAAEAAGQAAGARLPHRGFDDDRSGGDGALVVGTVDRCRVREHGEAVGAVPCSTIDSDGQTSQALVNSSMPSSASSRSGEGRPVEVVSGSKRLQVTPSRLTSVELDDAACTNELTVSASRSRIAWWSCGRKARSLARPALDTIAPATRTASSGCGIVGEGVVNVVERLRIEFGDGGEELRGRARHHAGGELAAARPHRIDRGDHRGGRADRPVGGEPGLCVDDPPHSDVVDDSGRRERSPAGDHEIDLVVAERGDGHADVGAGLRRQRARGVDPGETKPVDAGREHVADIVVGLGVVELGARQIGRTREDAPAADRDEGPVGKIIGAEHAPSAAVEQLHHGNSGSRRRRARGTRG